MKAIGFDISITSTGYAVLGHEPGYGTFKLEDSGTFGFDGAIDPWRLGNMFYESASALVRSHDCDCVGFESPAYGVANPSLTPQYLLTQRLLECCSDQSRDCMGVAPLSLKWLLRTYVETVDGPASAPKSKKDVVKLARRLEPHCSFLPDTEDHNVVDAWLVALNTLSVAMGGVLEKPPGEVFHDDHYHKLLASAPSPPGLDGGVARVVGKIRARKVSNYSLMLSSKHFHPYGRFGEWAGGQVTSSGHTLGQVKRMAGKGLAVDASGRTDVAG